MRDERSDTPGSRNSNADPKTTNVFFSEPRRPAGSAARNLQPGTPLLNRFQIKSLIGEGGFAAVYLAHDSLRNEDVALKVVDVGPCDRSIAEMQLEQERRMCNRLAGYNSIIQQHGLHFVPWQDTGLLLLSMEYASGGSFRKWLIENRHNRDKRREEGMDHFFTMCWAASQMHGVRTVHLDLKPDNFLFVDGTLKAADFGTSRCAYNLSSTVTTTSHTGSLVGTPTYMSPEQIRSARSKDLRPTSDIYSLGVILYEILDGDPPFDGTPEEIRGKHLNTPPPPIAGISDTLADVVQRCLAKFPYWRFQRVGDLREALKRARFPTMRWFPIGIKPKRSGPVCDYSMPLGNGVSMDMVWIEGGVYYMGSGRAETEIGLPNVHNGHFGVFGHFRKDGTWCAPSYVCDGEPPYYEAEELPLHRVEVAGFWLGRTPVTEAQFKAVMGFNHENSRGPDYPVDCISRDEIEAFLNRLMEKTENCAFWLPSESEWEYACRAGSKTDWCFGDDPSLLSDYAWYDRNSGGQVHPVGLKRPNAWGLYDMHGNVLEWCQGGFRLYERKSAESIPMGCKDHRVLRGGSCKCSARGTRSSTRYHYPSYILGNHEGFRVMRGIAST